jgi:hypothetical protein
MVHPVEFSPASLFSFSTTAPYYDRIVGIIKSAAFIAFDGVIPLASIVSLLPVSSSQILLLKS